MKRMNNMILAAMVGGWMLANLNAAQQPPSSDELNRCLAVLKSGDADRKAKGDACRELGRIGTRDAVKILVPLLDDPELSDMARYALEPNPAKEVDEALREALGRLQGRQLIGVMRSVAMRKDRKADAGLTRHLFSSDPEVAQAAARALGSLGTQKAARTLRASLPRVPKQNQAAFAEGLFRCAERLLEKGDRSEALVSYDHLRGLVDAADPDQAAVLAHVQAGATRGLIMASGKRGVPLMLETLSEGNPPALEGALRAAVELPGASVTRKLAEAAKTLAGQRQVPVIRVLGFRGDKEALGALADLANQGTTEARLAAIVALGQIGRPEVVPVLENLLTSADAQISKAALETVGGVPGKAADEAAIKLLRSSDKTRHANGLELVARRRLTSALPDLFRQAREGESGLRAAAIRQCGELGSMEEIPALLRILQEANSTEIVTAVQQAIESIGERTTDKPQMAKALVADWARYSPDQKVALLEALGANSSRDALQAVRSALSENNEKVRAQAVRVVANWADPEAAPDILRLASQTERSTDRALGLRGYLRLARQGEVSAKEKLAMCRKAETLVQTPDEKRLLISAVGSVQSVEAMQMLTPSLDQADTREEAATAIVTIADRILKKNESAAGKKALVPHLERVVQSAAGEEIKKKAQAALELAGK